MWVLHPPNAALPVLAVGAATEGLKFGGGEPISLSEDAAASTAGAQSRLVQPPDHRLRSTARSESARDGPAAPLRQSRPMTGQQPRRPHGGGKS